MEYVAVTAVVVAVGEELRFDPLWLPECNSSLKELRFFRGLEV